MGRRRFPYYVTCAEPDCSKMAHYEARTRADQVSHYEQLAKWPWRCDRHTRPAEIMSPADARRVIETASKIAFEGGPPFWGSTDPVGGIGWRAYARDFPAGSRLRVTVEILPPEII